MASEFANLKVFYPRLEGLSGHDRAAVLVASGKILHARSYLSSLVQEITDVYDVLLLSSEKFETFLVKPWLGVTFEDLLHDVGVDGVEWIFCTRTPWERFLSLYQSLPYYGVGGNFENLAKEILTAGYFTFQSNGYEHSFAFDYERLLDEFRKRVQGGVRALPLGQQGTTSAAHEILKECLGHRSERVWTELDCTVKFLQETQPFDLLEVERQHYLCFMGSSTDGSVDPNVEWILQHRAEKIMTDMARFKQSFDELWSAQAVTKH